MDEELESKREVGDVLENNIEYIFKVGGFHTEKNIRLAKYEIDVLAKFGDRKIIIECKNYQNSHLVIRNLIHQWNSKNKIIKAGKIILVIYGVNIKNSDKELASKFNIEIWGKDEVIKLFSLLMNPTQLREALLKAIDLKPISISELYRPEIEKLIFYPLLANEDEDKDETYKVLMRALKVFIRTKLQLEGTTKDERWNHIGLFEKDYDSGYSQEIWKSLKERLNTKAILPQSVQKKYLNYLLELNQELSDVRKWFSGTSEITIRRLLKARIYDSLFSKKDICEFGFDQSKTVKVSAEEGRFIISVNESDDGEIEILNWVLTSENFIIKQVKIIKEQEEITEIPGWEFHSIEETVEAVYRILNEYYEHKDGKKLLDFALNPKKSGCFIATAAYGTPFAAEINILRQWRDSFLLKHILGKMFVKTYYTISPPIAEYISKRNKLRAIVRLALNPYVKFLTYFYKKKN